MNGTAHSGATRDPLSDEIIARTRTSLTRIYTAAREAESIMRDCRSLSIASMTIDDDGSDDAARTRGAGTRAARAAVLELLSLPPERWRDSLAAAEPRLQRATLKRLITATDDFVRTAPDRAYGFADTILAIIRNDRLPDRAPVLRRHLAGRALLARSRALIALRVYAGVLPAIAEAYRVFPRTIAFAHYRIDAELLRGRALAATDHPAEALETLVAGARRAIEHVKPLLLVDALTALALVLCTYAEYGLAQPALTLAARIAAQPGNESALTTLHAAITECAFLGYPVRRAP